MGLRTTCLMLSALILGAQHSFALGATGPDLSNNIRIASQVLRYDLQYRVYLPPGYESLSSLPVLYMTDGQHYASKLSVPVQMDRLIKSKKTKPAIAVFIDPRDPDKLSDNRRQQEFFCNTHYVRFITDELVREIDANYKTSSTAADRVILGLSFGGLNSACMGLLAYQTFTGIAMQSPALHPAPNIRGAYKDTDKLPLKIFLSSGNKNDNEVKTRAFKKILEAKGYPLKYIEVDGEHNWANWKPLIDDVLLYYFALDAREG